RWPRRTTRPSLSIGTARSTPASAASPTRFLRASPRGHTPRAARRSVPVRGVRCVSPSGLPPCTPPREPHQSGTDAAHRDLRHERHGHEPHQPRPKVGRDPGAAPIQREDILGVAQRPASRQLAHLSQEALVGAQLPVLLRVRYNRTDDLRTEHLLVPAGRLAGEVDALVLRRECTTITTWSNLLELDHRLSLVRIH